MAVKIGVNGFGRIGRTVLRIAANDPAKFDIRGINLRNADPEYMAYLLKYDSVFGRFNGTVEAKKDSLVINGKEVKILSSSEVADIRWSDCGAEYVIESTGANTTAEKAMPHIVSGGAHRVVLTSPSGDKETPMYVMGVNHTEYDPSQLVISNASCTTNCLAPLAKVVNDNFGIVQGLMSTIHAATSKQKTTDARVGKDWRTGRSVFENIIPTSTGAAKAVGRVIPELEGRLTGMSFRIPASNVSVIDLTARLAKPTTYREICQAVEDAANGYMKGVIAYTNDQVVSVDMRGEPHTCVFDELAGIMIDDDFVKLIAWYDNEFGYSTKVLELTHHMASVCGEC